jgi:hypothetical protein
LISIALPAGDGIDADNDLSALTSGPVSAPVPISLTSIALAFVRGNAGDDCDEVGVCHCHLIFLTLVMGVAVVFVFVIIISANSNLPPVLLPFCCTTIYLYS